MNTVILKYQKNFADNLSEIAYSKIIEDGSNIKCYFENNSDLRSKFERKMSNFNMDIRYISANQVKSIVDKSYFFTRKLIKSDKIGHIIKKRSRFDKIIDVNCFKIDNIDLITNSIKKQFAFKNLDFIVNYDLLDEIQSSNSIGLYINKSDRINDLKYISNAIKRLNKYIKKPKLYIFSSKIAGIELSDIIGEYKYINLIDWREEFYLLTQCKNKIIVNSPNAYSESFWASVLNNSTQLVAYNSKLNVKKSPENWIAI